MTVCREIVERGVGQYQTTVRPGLLDLLQAPEWLTRLVSPPERFSPEHSAARPRFAYIPFGAGPRVCIGAAFAMEEALLALAMIAQRYRLHLKPGHPVEPQGLITLRPRYGLRMLLERRPK